MQNQRPTRFEDPCDVTKELAAVTSPSDHPDRTEEAARVVCRTVPKAIQLNEVSPQQSPADLVSMLLTSDLAQHRLTEIHS
jgi:hypothetical protein